MPLDEGSCSMNNGAAVAAAFRALRGCDAPKPALSHIHSLLVNLILALSAGQKGTISETLP